MADNGPDPYDPEGKNLREVIPQVRKEIRSGRLRIIAAVITFVISLIVAYRGFSSSGFFFLSAPFFLTISAIALWGAVMEGLRLRSMKARLAVSERRLEEEEKP